MRSSPWWLVAVVLPSLALAQAKEVKEKPSVPLNEIEHGFYIGLTGGFWAIVNPPINKTVALCSGDPCSPTGVTVDTNTKQPFSGGQSAQVEIGYQFSERVSVAIFVQGTANRAGSDYTGKSHDPRTGAPTASGDFTTVIPGALARVGIWGFNDSQDIKRTWIYARLGAGYVLYQPKALLPVPDVCIFAGPGVEYFTRLRHFSIGLEANFVFMALTQAFGFTVTPMLRYSF